MFCPKCSTENPREALSCLSCGAELPAEHAAQGAYAASTTAAVPAPGSLAYSHAAPGALYNSGLVDEENTSGRGYDQPVPVWAGGWNFAAAVPFGLFALYNGMHTWGVVGILLTVLGIWMGPLMLPFCIGYIFYLGLKGREMAWRGRRFANRAQFETTMRVWNVVGAISLIVGPLICLVWILLLFSNMVDMPAFFTDTGDPGCYTSS